MLSSQEEVNWLCFLAKQIYENNPTTSPIILRGSRLLYDWQSVSMSWYRAPLWDSRPDITSCRNVAEICGLVSTWGSLWREDGSAICGVITQWSKSRRTRNHALLSHLRLAQPVFISPRDRVAQLYLWTLGSLHVVLYDSPLMTRRAKEEVFEPSPYKCISFRNRMVLSKIKVKVKLWPTASQSYCKKTLLIFPF
jgi:hypothetical protein